MSSGYRSFSVTTVQRMPSTPWSAISVIWAWQCSDLPQRTVRKGSATVFSRASSPFRTARPSFFRWVKISHLAFRMPSRLPKYSM